MASAAHGLGGVAGVTCTNNGTIGWDEWWATYAIKYLDAKIGGYNVPSFLDGSNIPIEKACLVVKPSYGDRIAGERLFDFNIFGFLPYKTWFDDQVARSRGQDYSARLKGTACIPLGKYSVIDDVVEVVPHWEASQMYSRAGTGGMYMSDNSRFYVDICLTRSILFQLSDPELEKDMDKLTLLCLSFHSLLLAMQSFMMHRHVYKSKIAQLASSTEHPDVLQTFAASLVQADVNASHCGATLAIRRVVNRFLRTEKRAARRDSRRGDKSILGKFFLGDKRHERALRMVAIMSLLGLDLYTPGTGVALGLPKRIQRKMRELSAALEQQRARNAGKSYFSAANISVAKSMLGDTTLYQNICDGDDGEAKAGEEPVKFASWVKDVLNPEVTLNKVFEKYGIEDRCSLPAGVEMYGKYKPLNITRSYEEDVLHFSPSRVDGGAFIMPLPKKGVMFQLTVTNLSTQGTRKTRGDTRGSHAGALMRIAMSKSEDSISTAGVAATKTTPGGAGGAGAGAGGKTYEAGQYLTNDSFCVRITEGSVTVTQKHGAMDVTWKPTKITDADQVVVVFQNMEADIQFKMIKCK